MKKSIAIAEAYYAAMNKKDPIKLATYLHNEVELTGPLGEVHGKDALVKAAERAMALFNSITIRAKMSDGNQVMLAYDWDFPAPIGHLPAAVLMTIQNDLITKIELFYDGQPFSQL